MIFRSWIVPSNIWQVVGQRLSDGRIKVYTRRRAEAKSIRKIIREKLGNVPNRMQRLRTRLAANRLLHNKPKRRRHSARKWDKNKIIVYNNNNSNDIVINIFLITADCTVLMLDAANRSIKQLARRWHRITRDWNLLNRSSSTASVMWSTHAAHHNIPRIMFVHFYKRSNNPRRYQPDLYNYANWSLYESHIFLRSILRRKF